MTLVFASMADHVFFGITGKERVLIIGIKLYFAAVNLVSKKIVATVPDCCDSTGFSLSE